MANRIGPLGVTKILRRMLTDIRSELVREGITTGRRWRRPPTTCPNWCARDHTCTAHLRAPCSEHRSPPWTWRRLWGRLVATRVAGLDRRPYLEVRATVWLDGIDDLHALDQAAHLPGVVDAAIGNALAELALRHQRTPMYSPAPSALGHHRRTVVDGTVLHERTYW